MEQIKEYLRSNDPDTVGIGIELLKSYNLKEKCKTLKESGFNQQYKVRYEAVYKKTYYSNYNTSIGLYTTDIVYYKVTEGSIEVEEIPF